MNLIYPAHAKNQVRFEEKREKNVSARPSGDGSRVASLQNELGAGASRAGAAPVPWETAPPF